MAERLSTKQRIKMQNVAEREIQRYRDDHYLWHKHLHNVELDPMQILKMISMDRNPYTIDYSCRRTGKTVVKELYNLEQEAVHSDQELGIVAPREAQAITALDYQLDAIRRSPILSAYISFKSGRRRISDTSYQFNNRSRAQAYGIMASVDGGDLTIASLEEVDDMPADRLFGRFLLMLASTRRLGAAKDAKNDPAIRITGVFKGADTLQSMIDSGKYKALPIIDCYLGIEMGIVEKSYIEMMRDQLSPAEYLRQLLCKNVSSRDFIWDKWVHSAKMFGLKAGLDPVQPMPGETYKKRGLVSFGYDHSGHGESVDASRSSIIVWEQIGSWLAVRYARTWKPGTDDTLVKNDLISLWEYFSPDAAMGDAFGVGMLAQLNDDLFIQGLITIDRRAVGDGDSTATTWIEWAFSPIRFEGMTKHQMATALRQLFSSGRAILPYIDHRDMDCLETVDYRALVKQLTNIKQLETSKSFSSYKMKDKKVGDDLFDAAMAGLWALITRGAIVTATAQSVGTRSRESMLGMPSLRLPSDPVEYRL